jgi:hypothetical protein
MEERILSLQDALKLNTEALVGVLQQGDGDFTGWEAVSDRFLKSLTGLRSSALGDLRSRVNKILQVLRSRPCPRDGASLMRRYTYRFFGGCPPGGQGRKRILLVVARFLTYAEMNVAP